MHIVNGSARPSHKDGKAYNSEPRVVSDKYKSSVASLTVTLNDDTRGMLDIRVGIYKIPSAVCLSVFWVFPTRTLRISVTVSVIHTFDTV